MTNFRVPLVPAGFFAMVLGVIELGSPWRVGHRIWGLPVAAGDMIVLAGIGIWVLLVQPAFPRLAGHSDPCLRSSPPRRYATLDLG